MDKRTQENQLIRDLQQSFDERKFTALITPYFQYGFRVIFRLLLNKADSEDILQESLIRVLKNIQSFRFEAAFKTWFARICYYETLHFLEKKKRKKSVDLEEVKNIIASEDQIHQNLERQDRQQLVNQAIQALAPKSRLIILKFYKEELSIKEIAEELSEGESSVKVILHRARQKLKAYLKTNFAIQASDLN